MLHPHLSSASSVQWTSGNQKDGHLDHFCYFPPESKTSPRLHPISLEHTWLAASAEGAGHVCSGFLLSLSFFGPAGKALRGFVLNSSLRGCFSFAWSQPSSSSLNVPYCHLGLVCSILPPVGAFAPVGVMGKSFGVGLANQGSQDSSFPHILESLQEVIGS